MNEQKQNDSIDRNRPETTSVSNRFETNATAAASTKRVLIVTAVDAEKEAVLRGLGDKAAERFDVIAAGVGPASAAAGTAAALAFASAAAGASALAQGSAAPSQTDAAQASAASSRPGPLAGTGLTPAYTLVVSAGIGGGFPGRADVGSLVVADAMVAADLGSQTPDGFLSVDELGFGSSRVAADAVLAARLRHELQRAGLAVSGGTAVTVSTATGTAETAAELLRRVPDAAAEGMEGFGVATAAQQFGLPALELRAISNAVGPRDRDAWRIKDALDALQAASSILREVLTS
ncbi:futalosine hydrolase [Paenibacillus sp. E222]|uniref:futalosine hydrolase n=1 Tax=Paenibacillus sp. E222 TaxID=2748863 RepID=UPI0015C59535|nr:futalosine hydrolase [Paenibacillus sp. E222]QLG42423.1 futalosine hydrolase [Paenibacillus sp. E222]